jgi:hypothetical protein
MTDSLSPPLERPTPTGAGAGNNCAEPAEGNRAAANKRSKQLRITTSWG